MLDATNLSELLWTSKLASDVSRGDYVARSISFRDGTGTLIPTISGNYFAVLVVQNREDPNDSTNRVLIFEDGSLVIVPEGQTLFVLI